MIVIFNIEQSTVNAINNELGIDTISSCPYCYEDIIPEATFHSSCMLVLSAETDSKTMIIRNGKAFLLDNNKFYYIERV